MVVRADRPAAAIIDRDCPAARIRGGLPESGRRGYTGCFQTVFMTVRDEFDPLAPQREAAFFYGLFLRGHTVEALRQDIDVPRPLLDKWMRAHDFEAAFREN